MERYADVILPLALDTLTYEVPCDMQLTEGEAVAVSMGHSSDKYFVAIVWKVHSERPPYKKVRQVLRKLFETPLLDEGQRNFWGWLSEYYICSLGEVMRIALPSMVKVRSSSEEEFEKAQFKARQEIYLSLCEEFVRAESQAKLLSEFPARATARKAALEEILQMMHASGANSLPRRLLTSPAPHIKALEKMGVIALESRDVQHYAPTYGEVTLPKLSAAQSKALVEVEKAFENYTTTLLFGVTGSGKSEIYINLIAKVLEGGGDVLLLLPEIALTSQLQQRMERVFGACVSLYHSRLTARARTELYLNLASGKGGNLVVGARSAIFLPLRKLELIIVDEEHDTSYKQSDPTPRYNARDCAVACAAMLGVKTLLGSATPSLESWSNANGDKYGYVVLNERFGGSKMAQVTISDTLRAVKRGERRNHLNVDLKVALDETVTRGEQAILFQNRRGVAPYVECPECGESPRCGNCNVTLTLHSGYLECHYCGHKELKPEVCPHCKRGELKAMGFGTERVEQSLQLSMPEVVTGRLDGDTARAPGRFKALVEQFEQGEIQLLVGTQIVTKGFDFGGVTLVGVLNADNLLCAPDFRAEERAYQLLTQVAGRAGRRDKKSQVIIQTSQPTHRVLSYVQSGDYESLAAHLLEERRLFLYPPYSRLIEITMRHADKNLLYAGASAFAVAMRQIFDRRLIGPTPPPVDRIRGEYLVKMVLKIEIGKSFLRAQKILVQQVAKLAKSAEFKSIKVQCDVDPQ